MSATSTALEPRETTPALLGSLVLSLPVLALASWGDATEGNPLRRFIVTVAIAAVAAIVVFLRAVPRARSSSRVPVVLAILAVLSLPVFWSGVTGVLAIGAVAAARVAPIAAGASAWSR